MWKGGECYIIGGGSSILKQFDVPEELIDKVRNKETSMNEYSPYFSAIHGKHVIGINVAYLLGDWLDVIFFGDGGGFFLPNMKKLTKYKGLKVSCSPKTKDYEWIKWLARDRDKPYGLSNNPHKVAWNNNSGGAAINFAVHTGAKRIVLLGFDMNLNVDGKQHYHAEYRNRNNNTIKNTFKTHLKGFPYIARDAKRLKVEILNVNPLSAIENFQKVNLKDVL